MRALTKELLAKISKSRAKPIISSAHFEALILDYQEQGNILLDEIEQSFKKKSHQTKNRSPIEKAFLSSNERTKLTRKGFIKLLIAEAKDSFDKNMDVPKSKQTMPKLIIFYLERISESEFIELLRQVGEKNSARR